MRFLLAIALAAPWTMGVSSAFAEGDRLSLLFLGDSGHHRPALRARQLIPALARRGIDITYTEQLTSLNGQTLSQYDGLILYANHEKISPEQERELLKYVAAGHGFIPLHCASYCFLNSDRYVKLVGAQFKSHQTGTFRTEIAAPDHPIMHDFGGFESWDETYVHHRHGADRTVLELRVEGNHREPWTWVRTHGKGRVFYTAWGHDHRTWGHAGFQNLVERGVRWACKKDVSVVPDYRERPAFVAPEMTPPRQDVEPFKYVDVGPKIPNYAAGARWGTQDKPLTKMQQPLSPEESLKHYVTPRGFHLELYAAEPDLGGKPIAMNWDERGRLWVCETVDYPNDLQPPGEGRDRIRICEDTDGDWRADKFTVFAEKLSIPTAIAFYRGGAIVQNGTQTLYLKDTDGDDRADVRKVLIQGWTLGDTHGGVSNLRYALDNWFWGMQGYNQSAPEYDFDEQGRPRKKSERFRMGFFRFKLDNSDPPAVTELEFVRSTNNNTWGLGFSEEGYVFGSTANHNPSVYMPIANRYYERVRGWAPQQLGTIADTHKFDPVTDKVRQVDHHGGYTAGAGHALYTARRYPRQYWNRTAFVCGPTGHLVGTFVLKPGGTDFSSTSPCNLIASDDEWAAPIAAEVGPDGNVWVLDWYNYIVQHNPTPQGFKTGKGNAYQSDLRDKKHGRIYRVVYDAPRIAMRVDRRKARAHALMRNDLLNALERVGASARVVDERSDENVLHIDVTDTPRRFDRDEMGALEIKPIGGGLTLRFLDIAEVREERGEPACKSLAGASPDELVAALTSDNMLRRLHAQRLLAERGKQDAVPELIKLVADASVDNIGLNVGAIHALRTLPALQVTEDTTSPAGRAVLTALKHQSAAVRVNALKALSPSRDALLALLTEARSLEDENPHVRLAAFLALADSPAEGSPISRGTEGRNLARAITDPANHHDPWLLDAATSAAARHDRNFLEALALTRPKIPPAVLARVAIVAEHFARGRPKAADVSGLLSATQGAPPELVEVIFRGMAGGWPKDHEIELQDTDQEALARLLDALPARAKGPVLRLFAAWGSDALEKHSAAIVGALSATVADDTKPAAARIDAARQLVEFRPADGKLAGRLLAQATPQAPLELAIGLVQACGASRADGVGEAIVDGWQSWTPGVRAAAANVLLSRAELTRALLAGVQAGKLQLAELSLEQKQSLANHPDKQIAALAKKLLERGGGLPNPDRQKVLQGYLPLAEKTGEGALGKEVFKKHCAKCHTHAGEGTRIGPDLTGMAVHPKKELLGHIFDPSASVEGNFRTYTVITAEGRVLSGMLAGESKTTIELVDTEAKRHVVLREDIDELVASSKSLMPEGFEKQMSASDIVNLLEFLTARGKYVPLDLAKVATIVSTRGMFYDENAAAERLIFRDWGPKEFEGVPFLLVDPQGERVPNVVMLRSPNGKFPPNMPKRVGLDCNTAAKAIHLLSGVAGWGFPASRDKTVSLIVRLHYADGRTEDHPLKNAVHFADYIRRVDVPKSQLAFMLRNQQVRYLGVYPKRSEVIERIELVKGPDRTAPIVMAITVETHDRQIPSRE